MPTLEVRRLSNILQVGLSVQGLYTSGSARVRCCWRGCCSTCPSAPQPPSGQPHCLLRPPAGCSLSACLLCQTQTCVWELGWVCSKHRQPSSPPAPFGMACVIPSAHWKLVVTCNPQIFHSPPRLALRACSRAGLGIVYPVETPVLTSGHCRHSLAEWVGR